MADKKAPAKKTNKKKVAPKTCICSCSCCPSKWAFWQKVNRKKKVIINCMILWFFVCF